VAVLAQLRHPRDLRSLTEPELDELAVEIRDVLVRSVAANGGHLGPNLGAVELTIALHRVFDSPLDPIVFDTGHQAYVHKLLTGRLAGFERLRKPGGLSGYPSRAESEHDWVENSHASTSISYVDGLAKAFALRGETDRTPVAVIGDGALTGGMAWEALNNVAASDRPVVVVVNDNGRSYTPTVGGLAQKLDDMRTNPHYEQLLHAVKRNLTRAPLVGHPVYEALHGMKKGLKDFLDPQGMFEDLGLKYVGPVDGHDRDAVEHALRAAKRFRGPILVHVVTRKGFGYPVAERHEEDRLHGPGPFDPTTGHPTAAPVRTWTHVFGDALVELGGDRPDVVAVTAAMLHPTGLDAFAAGFPDRCYDVGIAEQHAVTSAAGMAMGGLHPVVAVYATFLNRAFDQVLMDVALHRLGVTFVLDRAGVTGDDGPSHNGMWDLSILQVVPGLRIAAPRDGTRLRELLREAVAVADAPTVLRFPKGAVGPDLPALDRAGGCDVLARTGAADVLVVAVGALAPIAVEVAARLADQGVGSTVVDPRWVKPLDPALVDLAAQHRFVLTVEDNGRVGGVGSVFAQQLRDAGVRTPLHDAGLPQRFLDHGSRAAVLADAGLTAQELARRVVEQVARLDHEPAAVPRT
jgi:1-deoxy-D-xylulose-5-phosphate synthase